MCSGENFAIPALGTISGAEAINAVRLFNEYQKSPELSEKFKKAESGINGVNLYTEIAKYISLYGSVRLLDTITEDEYVDIIYDAGKKLIDDLNK